ncbi:hypothetical protein G7K_5702-t1 [Saitoella complicata NRRL Y-17804]|uniref:CCHC-type domain-containing protein n=1 Tax=Saitoella complicata (strain BCRC 22490 / CBS 7301 / JCM 7358 / NBRC 10748 / NRRL Y-17804) TaxID=698492 RepID=A0A0E9NPK6_SAICN|nr:hypothetical protein G7K_5702-t1 [Saitoella complicata NRRL Y-17804]
MASHSGSSGLDSAPQPMPTMEQLSAMMHELHAQVADAQTSARTARLEAADAHTRLLAMEAAAATSASSTDTATTPPVSTLTSTPSIVTTVKEPKVDGKDKTLLKSFLSKAAMVFNTQPLHYGDDRIKILTTVNWLTGAAFDWVQPEIGKDESKCPEWLKNYDLFCKELAQAFGDPDEKRTYNNKLMNLKQTGSVIDYTVRFRQIAPYTDFDAKALAPHYYRGLKDEIKDAAQFHAQLETLDDIIEFAIRQDNRFPERRMEKKNSGTQHLSSSHKSSDSSGQPNHYKSKSSPVNSSHTPCSVPMDLSSSRTITPEKRDHRKKNNLCMYCGKPGHYASKCFAANGNVAKKSTRANATVPQRIME